MQPDYGFNFQWMCSWHDGAEPAPPDMEALEFLVEHGFRAVRVPMDYRFWTRGTAYQEPDELVFEHIDDYVMACVENELHCCLNLHRAPGWCINRPELETHSLWRDEEAQAGFVDIWRRLADRFATIEPEHLSFNLVNEPPAPGRHGLTRAGHEQLVRRTVAAIRELSPQRPIVVDGLEVGNSPMPELADLDLIQSCRGYAPMALSHWQAGWWEGSVGLPEPRWPGCESDGRRWDRQALVDFYAPWRALAAQGVAVQVGEFGCHHKTPAGVALPWMRDLLELWAEWGWGWMLWNFHGSFGISRHDRPGTRWQEHDGLRIDQDLFELLLVAHRRSGA